MQTDYSSDNSELPDRFQADREEQEGCPLAPELAVVIYEDWSKSNKARGDESRDEDQD